MFSSPDKRKLTDTPLKPTTKENKEQNPVKTIFLPKISEDLIIFRRPEPKLMDTGPNLSEEDLTSFRQPEPKLRDTGPKLLSEDLIIFRRPEPKSMDIGIHTTTKEESKKENPIKPIYLPKSQKRKATDTDTALNPTTKEIEEKNSVKLKFLEKISKIIEDIIKANEESKLISKVHTYDIESPNHNVLDHLIRLERLIPDPNTPKGAAFIFMLMYLDKYIEKKPDFHLNFNNFQYFLSVCLMVSMKQNNDFHYRSQVFADHLNIDLKRLNHMEVCYLMDDIGFDLQISKDTYITYCKRLFPDKPKASLSEAQDSTPTQQVTKKVK